MSSCSKERIVIIGSGPCGLGAAYRLQELGHDNFIVLEAGPHAGGLSVTVQDSEGFLWDMGGHVIFSHYRYFDMLLDNVNNEWCERERVCYVWQKNRFIPYPFQNNIHQLPQEDLHCCLQGLIDLERRKGSLEKPRNFHEWLQNSFGTGILDVFLVPYNRKVWGYDPTEMNTEWMGERVATVDLARIVNNVLTGKDDVSWGPNNSFRFPLRGGTGAIWQQLYEKIDPNRFRFNSPATCINTDTHLITLSDGSTLHYDKIISSMPLDCLCTTVQGQGLRHLPSNAPSFRYSSTHVIGIGLDGSPPLHLKHQCWMYFPEDNCPFYRVTVFSNYSPYHVPKPGQQWSLMAEVCETVNRPVESDKIVEQVIQGFYNTKLLHEKRDRIASRFHRRLEYGYPTPFYGRDELTGPIFKILEERGIYSRGRFGAWKYEVSNQDHTMMQGVEAADHILFGSEEMTFHYASVVNGRDWKCLGRMPRVGPSSVKTHDPARLIEGIKRAGKVGIAEMPLHKVKVQGAQDIGETETVERPALVGA